jgi:D-alanyl-D-alanine carboxypeptidase
LSADEPEYSHTLQQCWVKLGIPISLIAARRLPVFAEPEALEIAEKDADGREHLLVPEAAAAWTEMKTAAHADVVSICIVSAHRSIERQIEIVARKLRDGQSPEEIFSVTAPPGCSEHHTGRAIDIGTEDSLPLEIEFASTPAYRWLAASAGKFGFTLSYPEGNRWGYSYEPWHWCYRGISAPDADETC